MKHLNSYHKGGLFFTGHDSGARGLDAAGAIHLRQSRITEAFELYSEAARINDTFLDDPLACISRVTNVSIIIAETGDNITSFKVLESAKPMVDNFSQIYPVEYGNFLNNYAVGLLESGRHKEALYYIEVALASPFAERYPEWRETRDEIKRRGWRSSRSVVRVSKVSLVDNVLDFCPASEAGGAALLGDRPACEPAQIHSISEWKTAAMNKTPRPDMKRERAEKSEEPLERLKHLSRVRKQNEFIKQILRDDVDDATLDHLIDELAKKQTAKTDKPGDREQG